ncbi:MAG: cytidylate kinase-like family protein [Deltaproteobacteria bacterium]|nr:cytidylate kinase-like family protein [Deltaproteobacteria bacterium]
MAGEDYQYKFEAPFSFPPEMALVTKNYMKKLDTLNRIKGTDNDIYPTICFSRKVGIGALEIARMVADKADYNVVDRELLNYIASQVHLNEKTVALFDERYPGKLQEFLALTFGEKAFIESDYVKYLFRAVFAFANLQPTIFVGRGAHFILPRDKVLAVRIIGSKSYRVKRLVQIMEISKKEAGKKVKQSDDEQRAFFKKAYGKGSAPSSEFDLVINCDHFPELNCAAEIVFHAFKQKFKEEADEGQ